MANIEVTDRTLSIGTDVYQLNNIVRLSKGRETESAPPTITQEPLKTETNVQLAYGFGGCAVAFVVVGLVLGLVAGGVYSVFSDAGLPDTIGSLISLIALVAGLVAGAFAARKLPKQRFRTVSTPNFRDVFLLIVEYSSGVTRSLIWSYEEHVILRLKDSVQAALDRPPEQGNPPVTIEIGSAQIHNVTVNNVGGDQYNQFGHGNVGRGGPPPPPGGPPPPPGGPPPPPGGPPPPP